MQRTPLAAILAVSFLVSLGTGIFWFGIPFIADEVYGFSQTRNLVLYAVTGIMYVIGAFSAGRVLRRAGRRVSPRGVLAWTIGLQGAVCLVPIIVLEEWALWVTCIVANSLAAIIWPTIESYLTAGRHGKAMRSAIGGFNLVWMPAIVVAMLGMAPLLEEHGRWAIGALAPIMGVALLVLPRFRRFPAEHSADEAFGHVAAEYPMLLRSARVLLPVSYMITSAMSPLLPYRLEDLGVAVELKTPLSATWMVLRVVAVIVMWRLPFWHGRWGTLLLGAATLVVGFALIIFAPTVPLVVAGFILLGVGIGAIYYAALYYAMAVGHANVDAGGTHEGLIGVGYAIGPLASLPGAILASPALIVGVVWAIVGVCAYPAVRPYARARRERSRAAR